ncbi:MarR family winged helix-turn-helix transcriptional regulator [Fictibacillus barbaricus]|uniref:MarR family transcriptional regulator n=1 Tax=Fictibacillus barbaricus TaxID=182136 RepID=A0ABS2ZBD0_9BACL|nr:MarR family transcriptional regulator [Fictibacillus barbaricus]MBN3545220.1 MarR family transcriptional regulator [Fictibacillus barbaricus]GGB60707.1 organic hydroperoxide resistance transcriptional regulator [Fictibacillus barbaricus]
MNIDQLKLENQICFKIYTAEREITKLYRDLLHELNVTYPQYLVLLLLWEKNSLSVKELGQRLFLDSGTLTPMLKRMETNGLVERKRSLEDERSVIISLTEKGSALKEKAACIPSQLIENISIKKDELTLLNQTLTSMLEQLQNQSGK